MGCCSCPFRWQLYSPVANMFPPLASSLCCQYACVRHQDTVFVSKTRLKLEILYSPAHSAGCWGITKTHSERCQFSARGMMQNDEQLLRGEHIGGKRKEKFQYIVKHRNYQLQVPEYNQKNQPKLRLLNWNNYFALADKTFGVQAEVTPHHTVPSFPLHKNTQHSKTLSVTR